MDVGAWMRGAGSRRSLCAALGVLGLSAALVALAGRLGVLPTSRPEARPGEVAADDAGLFYSPWAWYRGGPACQTTHYGSWLKFGWTGRNLRLEVDVSMWDGAGISAERYPEIGYSIDDGPFRAFRLAPGETSRVLASDLPNGRHRCVAYLRQVDFRPERWRAGRQVALWRVTGLRLDPGSAAFRLPNLRPRRALFFGDSILDGAFNLGAETDSLRSWAEVAAARLDAEPGRVGFEGQSYAIAGNSTNGNVPPLFDPGDPSQSTWDRVDSRHSRLERGRFSPVPDYVFLCHGANDAMSRVPAATVEASVRGLLPRVRSASGPEAALFVLVPFEGFNRLPIRSAFEAYRSASLDPRCYLIDLGPEASVREVDVADDGTSVRRSFDGLHPDAAMHARLGAMVADRARDALSGTRGRSPED